VKIEDAVIMAELTTNYMRTSAKIQGVELDEQSIRLVDVIETLASYAKRQITQETVGKVIGRERLQ